jgi:hypothetical protein
MSKQSEYGQPKLQKGEELEYDGTPISRPSDTVVTFDPSIGYGVAATTDKDLMKKRIEDASKTSIKKVPKK